MNIAKRCMMILSIIISFPVLADTPKTAQPSSAPVHYIIICPKVSAITKDSETLMWSAPGGFKGYQKSFAQHIVAFLGAQWEGIRIGQIICSYRGKQKIIFPITLVYNKLVFEPKTGTGHWTKNLGGYRNCKTTKPSDCPFQIQIKPKVKNIYKEALQLKPKESVGTGL